MAEFDLGKQMGPLPMGMWLVVIGGGLFLGYTINKNMSKKSEQEAVEVPVQLTETGVGTGGGQFIYDPPQTGRPESAPDTNAAWSQRALNWLIAQRHDPAVADQAVRKYLSALPLTVTERAMITLAIAANGPPPEPLPPVDEPAAPTPAGPRPSKVSGIRVARTSHMNRVTWGYSGPPIAGFNFRIHDLKTGKTYTYILPPSARSYAHPGGKHWTWKTRPTFIYFCRAFQGSSSNPTFGFDSNTGPVKHLV